MKLLVSLVETNCLAYWNRWRIMGIGSKMPEANSCNGYSKREDCAWKGSNFHRKKQILPIRK